MAVKNIPYALDKLKTKEDNFFSLPEAFSVGQRLKWKNFKVGNLKPNTKYKVMLDNYPGRDFEDITDFCKPLNESVRDNTHRTGGTSRWVYLKSSADGILNFKCRPFGTEAVNYTGSTSSGSVDYTTLWKNLRVRDRNTDKARENVKLIEYSQVENPDSTAKIKTVKFDYNDVPDETGRGAGIIAAPPKVITNCWIPPSGKNTVYTSWRDGKMFQTFYIDAKRVANAETVDVTDVELYLRRKPPRRRNSQGAGMIVALCKCRSDGSPDLSSIYRSSVTRVSWAEIKASSLATSSTVVSFKTPVKLQTNQNYAIAIKLEDESYTFWYSKKGDLLLVNGKKTDKRSSGSSKEHRGDLYMRRSLTSRSITTLNSRETPWKPNPNLDLKFDINIAEYSTNDVSINYVNQDYEFVQLTNDSDSTWGPAEEVYKVMPNLNTGTGSVSIAAGKRVIRSAGDPGDVPDFTGLKQGDKLILIDSTDSTIKQIFTVDTSISAPNASSVYVSEYAEQDISGDYFKTVTAEVELFDIAFKYIRLANSSVNYVQYSQDTNMVFEAGDTIVGIETGSSGEIDSLVDLELSTFRTNWNGVVPSQFKVDTFYNFSSESGGVYDLDNTSEIMFLNKPNHVKGFESLIASRSLEVKNSANLHNPTTDAKSAILNTSYTYKGANTKTYTAPSFELGELQLVTHRWDINNDSTNEHTNNGNARSKHISKVLTFPGKNVEDVRVVLNGYRPQGTDIEVYAKIMSPEDSANYSDKFWTKLDIIGSSNVYSNPKSERDYKEFEFTFPKYPPSASTLSGTYTSTSQSNEISTETGNVSDLSVGDVIKFYSPLFPENYGVFSVQSINVGSNSFTINESIDNYNIIGTGFVIDLLETPYTAFINKENDDIVRYFGTNGESYDYYDRIAVKIVLLSNTRNLVPKVDDYRVIGISA